MRLRIEGKFGLREFEGKKIAVIVTDDRLVTVKVEDKINFVDAVINVTGINFG